MQKRCMQKKVRSSLGRPEIITLLRDFARFHLFSSRSLADGNYFVVRKEIVMIFNVIINCRVESVRANLFHNFVAMASKAGSVGTLVFFQHFFGENSIASIAEVQPTQPTVSCFLND